MPNNNAMLYDTINPELFKLNRKRFMRKMLPDSIAIFHSNDLMPRNGDGYFPFRQNSDLLYLSGLDQEETVVVLFPDCPKEGYSEVAFIKKTSERIAQWEGEKLSIEQAKEIAGIAKVFWLDEMDSILTEMILLAKRIYLNLPENPRFQQPVPSRDARFAKELKEKYPLHKYHRSQPMLKQLRMIKSGLEIDVMQQAINITNKAFHRVLEFVHPGVMEYEIEAEISRVFLRNRAKHHAYEPIIASGKNACVLHYIANDKPCKDGDLILMDFGAEYGNYAADLSRTIPANGQFTQRQAAVYNAVLRVMKAATEMLVPGITLEEYNKEVGLLMQSELLDLKLIDKTDIKNQDPEWPAYKTYFMHGTSHHLGLDVHDASHKEAPFQSGMVFTCEPGIYIPEESIGVRIENDILITDHQPLDLMRDIPREIEEIEELMNVMIAD